MTAPLLVVRDLQFIDRGPFSFALNKGECVGIQAASGTGKTQLFRALADLIPSSGDVSLEGRSKDTVAASSWRTQVTMLPTDSAWWYDTVEAHFGEEYRRDRLRADCEDLGLSSQIGGWHVARLSTGEKQRLALLRCLQVLPKVLLLDEPTSGLDSENTAKVETLLNRLVATRELTVMWVSHDAGQLTRVSTRILHMEKNSIHEV